MCFFGGLSHVDRLRDGLLQQVFRIVFCIFLVSVNISLLVGANDNILSPKLA